MKLKRLLLVSLAMFLITFIISSCSKKEQVTQGAPQLKAFAVKTSDGFAAGTTGGSGGSSITVTTASAFKTAAESSTRQIITVSGMLYFGMSSVYINSNKTIIGANSSSGISGNLVVSGKTNVIIQNLNLTNPSGIGTGDALEISGSTKVFVTKCTFSDAADGQVDIVRASDNITVSWCRFRYVNQTSHKFSNLIGNSDDATGDRGKLHVTSHHNWYDVGVSERMPRVRFGYVHCYNNYYGSNSDNYTVGVGNEAHILLENNSFENQGNPWKDYRSSSSVSYQLRWTGNTFVNSPVPTWATNSSSIFSRPYSYSLLAGSSVKSSVTGGAGNR